MENVDYQSDTYGSPQADREKEKMWTYKWMRKWVDKRESRIGKEWEKRKFVNIWKNDWTNEWGKDTSEWMGELLRNRKRRKSEWWTDEGGKLKTKTKERISEWIKRKWIIRGSERMEEEENVLESCSREEPGTGQGRRECLCWRHQCFPRFSQNSNFLYCGDILRVNVVKVLIRLNSIDDIYHMIEIICSDKKKESGCSHHL